METKEEKKQNQLIRRMNKNKKSLEDINFTCPKCGSFESSPLRIITPINVKDKTHGEYSIVALYCTECKYDLELYQVKTDTLAVGGLKVKSKRIPASSRV